MKDRPVYFEFVLVHPEGTSKKWTFVRGSLVSNVGFTMVVYEEL